MAYSYLFAECRRSRVDRKVKRWVESRSFATLASSVPFDIFIWI